jgi:serine protease Do
MSEIEDQKRPEGKFRGFRIVFFVVLVFFVSGVSSVVSEKYVFPWLATRKWFEDKEFFKQAMDNVTVINKTEQVTVNESGDISGYTDRSASSVVEIVSRKDNEKEDGLSDSIKSVSGIIVTSDGLVASYGNGFFGGKDSRYKIFSQDGRSFDARVVVWDSFSGVVLLQMESAQNLPVAEYIAPEDIKPGMKAVLLGRSGFNNEIALKLGIMSQWAKSFSISGPLASSEKLQGVILSDLDSGASLEDFFAGGVAVSQEGNIIGITGERKEGSGSTFFIVPVNHLEHVVDEFLAKGKLERAAFGVYYVSLSREIAFATGNGQEKGALVHSPSGQQGLAVIAGSAAEKAGIKINDIILSVNGEEISPDQNLAYLVSKYKPGDKVDLKISRDGKEMNISVTLG